MDCSKVPDMAWLVRYRGRCYAYPDRDCPGWQPGSVCGRTGTPIPDDAEPGEPE